MPALANPPNLVPRKAPDAASQCGCAAPRRATTYPCRLDPGEPEGPDDRPFCLRHN